MPSEVSRSPSTELADRVKTILTSRELTAYQLSRLSEILFGTTSHYYIPPNFYYRLRVGTAAPNIYQLFALSKISDYRLVDWLRIFGYDLDELPRLEALLHGRRTVILDSTSYDEEAWVPWFQEITASFESEKITPLSSLIAPGNFRRVNSIEESNKKSFLYAKVGQEDALAYPFVVPGSVVRADPVVTTVREQGATESCRQPLYLVEHSKGVNCCLLKHIDSGHVEVISEQLPYAKTTLQLAREIRILGLVDLEIRPLAKVLRPWVPAQLARPWQPSPLPEAAPGMSLGELIRAARYRSGLHFREASSLTRKIAEHFADGRYFITSELLSSYERLNLAPRHVHRIMSLCIVYCIAFWDFLHSTDIALRQSGREPIPKDLLVHSSLGNLKQIVGQETDSVQTQPFPFSLFEHIPLFLRNSLSNITDLPRVSIRDVFWTGGQRKPLHPLLERSQFIVVNRRVKRPVQTVLSETWEKPLYLILMRDGTYLCGQCTLEGDILILQSHPNSSLPPRVLRNRRDAEIAGRVVAIVRSL
jgi:hypothetical protein